MVPIRGISEVTLRYYEAQTRFVGDQPRDIGFIYPNGAIKTRDLTEKKFYTYGPMREASLFGKNKFDPGSKSSITITEGEIDALSVYEMLKGETAAVSVKSGSSARKDCIAEWEYINSFDKIILCFDSDEVGQKAAKDVASLFDFNKVYQVKFTKYKDANEYLEKQEVESFYTSWKNARRYAPDNIISSFREIEKALEESKEDMLGTYPFDGLNAALYGMHRGEVVVVKAPEGVGKTEFFRALEHHLLKTTNHNLGIIHLEEDNATTVKAIAGYELEAPAVLPDCGLSKQDILEGYKRAVRDNEGRVHIYSSFDVEDENTLLGNIRFLASAAGCKFIFLDHITWLATGLADEDERKKLDRLSQKLKLLAKELGICIVEISHVNDDGKTRGSRNISKVANTVISLFRDLTHFDSIVRNTILITIDKARLGGRTGPAGRAVFNPDTGKLVDDHKVIS